MQCPHHPTCPGCAFMGLEGSEQLQRKRRRITAAFRRYEHLPNAPAVRQALHTEAYRHRVKLPVGRHRNRVFTGLFDRRTGRVLNTPDCPVATPAIQRALGALQIWLRDHTEVHAIDLRESSATGELALLLATDQGRLRRRDHAMRQLRQALPRLASVALSTADPERKRVMGTDPEVIGGAPFLEERVGSTRYRLHPGAFFQVDPRTATVLHDIVAGYVGEARSVLDLYAGVGAYALALAPGRDHVVAVESLRAAARSAGSIAPAHMQVVSAPVERYRFEEHFDVAILNPARRGSTPAVLSRVAKTADRIVYVSCSPETLARDLDVLAAHGMRVRNLDAIDLFPQTAEVETIVHLTKGSQLRTWEVEGGRAGGPWHGHPSGAVGQVVSAVTMVVGPTPRQGIVGSSSWERIGTVAGHSILRLDVEGSLQRTLNGLAKRGHLVAGIEPKTSRFFADKAGLIRPFVHVMEADDAFAPLHGDLQETLLALHAPRSLLDRLIRP